MAGQVWHPADRRNSSDLGRSDNNVLGVPPELIAVGAAKAVSAAAQPAISAAQRVGAGVSSIASQAAPAIKYELTKTALEKIGVPTPLAVGAALAISGYKKGGATAAETSAPMAEGYERFMPNSSAATEATIPADAARAQQLIAPAHEAVAARHAAGEISNRAMQASAASLKDADVAATQSLISQGMAPSSAAVKASGGNPSRFAAIMQHFMAGGAK